MRAAEHHIHAGDRPRARALLEAILEDTPPGPTRSDALRLLAEVRYNEQGFAGVVPLLEEALEGADDPALRGRDRARPLLRPLQPPRRRRRRRRARRPRARARRGRRDPTLLAQALAVRVMIDFLLGRGIDWAMVDRAVALEGGDRAGAALPAAERDRRLPEAVDRALRRGARGADRAAAAGADSGDESDLAYLLTWLAALELVGGDLDAAEALADEAEVHAALAGSEFNRAWALSQRAMVLAHRGDADAARADADEAAEICARFEAGNPMLWVAARSACSSCRSATPPRRGPRSSRPWRRSRAASRSRSCWCPRSRR